MDENQLGSQSTPPESAPPRFAIAETQGLLVILAIIASLIYFFVRPALLSECVYGPSPYLQREMVLSTWDTPLSTDPLREYGDQLQRACLNDFTCRVTFVRSRAFTNLQPLVMGESIRFNRNYQHLFIEVFATAIAGVLGVPLWFRIIEEMERRMVVKSDSEQFAEDRSDSPRIMNYSGAYERKKMNSAYCIGRIIGSLTLAALIPGLWFVQFAYEMVALAVIGFGFSSAGALIAYRNRESAHAARASALTNVVGGIAWLTLAAIFRGLA